MYQLKCAILTHLVPFHFVTACFAGCLVGNTLRKPITRGTRRFPVGFRVFSSLTLEKLKFHHMTSGNQSQIRFLFSQQ